MKAAFECGGSRIVSPTLAYRNFPFLEFRFRVHWNEARKRLKLAVPSVFAPPMRCAKFPAGRSSGRATGRNRSRDAGWSQGGAIGGKTSALGIVNSGQYGFDLKDTASLAATITHRPADRVVMSDYPAF